MYGTLETAPTVFIHDFTMHDSFRSESSSAYLFIYVIQKKVKQFRNAFWRHSTLCRKWIPMDSSIYNNRFRIRCDQGFEIKIQITNSFHFSISTYLPENLDVGAPMAKRNDENFKNILSVEEIAQRAWLPHTGPQVWSLCAFSRTEGWNPGSL